VEDCEMLPGPQK